MFAVGKGQNLRSALGPAAVVHPSKRLHIFILLSAFYSKVPLPYMRFQLLVPFISEAFFFFFSCANYGLILTGYLEPASVC